MTTAVQVQLRRGTASQVASFTGAQGELVVDTTTNRVVVQDGSTAGGFAAAKLSEAVTRLQATDGAVVSQAAGAAGVTALIGGPGGMVNKFRNGAMDVWQRGTSSLTCTTSGNYTADGWIVLPSGVSVTAAQAAGRLLTKNSLQVTGATSVTGLIVKQRIESLIAAAFCSQTVTVQAQIYNSTGGSITPKLTVNRPSAQDNYGSVTADVNAVSLQSCAAGSWTQISYMFAANAASYNGLEIVFDFGNNFGAGTKSIQIAECDIRVTPGASTGLNANPPPPELRPVAAELAFCQRYFWNFAPGASGASAYVGFLNSPTNPWIPIILPVTMRAAPTGTLSAASDWKQTGAAADGVGSAYVFNSMTPNGGVLQLTTASANTAGQACMLRTANAGAYMQFTAEL